MTEIRELAGQELDAVAGGWNTDAVLVGLGMVAGGILAIAAVPVTGGGSLAAATVVVAAVTASAGGHIALGGALVG